jgi:ribosomal-protein-serine acetyltransferase
VLRRELDGTTHLRLLEEADAHELAELIAANRRHLAQWLPWARQDGLSGTLAFIRTTRRQLADENGLQTAIVRAGRIVGVVGFHAVDRVNQATSIGYWLAEAEQGRGTMTRAVGALVDHALSGWRLHRVEIRVATGNARSRAIPERLGFRHEGTLRGAERHGEDHLDLDVFSVLAGEWGGGPR